DDADEHDVRAAGDADREVPRAGARDHGADAIPSDDDHRKPGDHLRRPGRHLLGPLRGCPGGIVPSHGRARAGPGRHRRRRRPVRYRSHAGRRRGPVLRHRRRDGGSAREPHVTAKAHAGFDPFATLVHLREDGAALSVAWTLDVFRTLATGAGDRVVGVKHGTVPADFHADAWEVHPGGEEVLYLLTGALDVVLDEPAGEQTFGLRGGQACLVPRGVWHRLVLRQPSALLFITPAHGTRQRAVGTARPDD